VTPISNYLLLYQINTRIWLTELSRLVHRSFATNIARSDAPNVAYATVYPLATLLRILSAQVLAIILFR